jgi:hypothetical protein
MRYQNYLQRYSATMKSVLDERRVIMTKPQSASMLMAASLLSPQFNKTTSSLLTLRRKTVNNNN